MKRGVDIKSLVLGAFFGALATLVLLAVVHRPVAQPLEQRPVPGELLQQAPKKPERRGIREVWTLVSDQSAVGNRARPLDSSA